MLLTDDEHRISRIFCKIGRYDWTMALSKMDMETEMTTDNWEIS